MAEERLIDNDEDKNRKYRIRKNADGEDELIIIAGGDEEAEDIQDGQFYVAEAEEDDEEAAVMTPEQLAERDRLMREEQERLDRFCEVKLERARTLLTEDDYDGAAYELSLAEEQDGKNGAVSAMKLRAVSRNFTDFTRLEECVQSAEAVAENCSDEQKKELAEVSQPLVTLIGETTREVEQLYTENEVKRAERQVVFLARRKRAGLYFLCTALPFLAFLILALSYSTVMFAKQDGTNIVLTIVFAAIALLFFIATLVTAHKLWAAQRNISLNGKNSSTKLGRKYEEKTSFLKALNAIYSAINGL